MTHQIVIVVIQVENRRKTSTAIIHDWWRLAKLWKMVRNKTTKLAMVEFGEWIVSVLIKSEQSWTYNNIIISLLPSAYHFRADSDRYFAECVAEILDVMCIFLKYNQQVFHRCLSDYTYIPAFYFPFPLSWTMKFSFLQENLATYTML